MTQTCPQPDRFARETQVIAAALFVGAMTFVGIAVVIVHVVGNNPESTGMIVSLIMAGVTLAQIVPFFVIPAQMANSPQSPQTGNLGEGLTEHHSLYRGQLIIRLAILEGACFMNTIAYIIEHNWWSLAIVGGLLFIMLLLFPTRTRIAHFVESRQLQP